MGEWREIPQLLKLSKTDIVALHRSIQLREEVQQVEKKVAQFNKWVDNWDQAEKLRRFITAYERESVSWLAEKQSQYRSWIEWATSKHTGPTPS